MREVKTHDEKMFDLWRAFMAAYPNKPIDLNCFKERMNKTAPSIVHVCQWNPPAAKNGQG
jgi:hypothetical protein